MKLLLSFHTFIILLACNSGSCIAQFNNPLSMAAGNSILFIKGSFSAEGNNALSATEKTASLGFYASNLYALRSLNAFSLSFCKPFGNSAFTLQMKQGGNGSYQVFSFRPGVALNMRKGVLLACSGLFEHLRIQQYGSVSAYRMNASMFASLNKELATAFMVEGISLYSEKNKVFSPTAVFWGIMYSPEKSFQCGFELCISGGSTDIKTNFSYKPDPSFSIIAGTNKKFSEFCFGLRWRSKGPEFSYAAAVNAYTGISNSIGLSYEFKK